MPFNHFNIWLSRSSAFNHSQNKILFQWIGSSHQVAKYLSFSISTSNEYSGLIFFKIEWFDLHAAQGILNSSKASIIQGSVIFMIQLSHLNITPGKSTALTIWNFAGKVMSLVFNTLSRFVIAFLPRIKPLLLLWLKTLSTLIFGVPQNSLCHCFHHFPIYLPWSDGTGCHDRHYLNVEF